jgi:hypothetical protein
VFSKYFAKGIRYFPQGAFLLHRLQNGGHDVFAAYRAVIQFLQALVNFAMVTILPESL